MQKTLNNLAKAFIGESQARNRYTFYAKTAKKEGYEQLSEVFLLTADNEREHAKWLLRLINELGGKDIIVEAEVPTVLGNTVENLKSAIKGESYENLTMYPDFATIAEEENLPEIAKRLRAIAVAEKHHEERFKKFLYNIENNKVFQKDEEVNWVCRKCGYLHKGTEAPEKCPSCDHPQSYFEME
ncbi:MAG: rubrerythrin family protein [Candidatus Pacebacteria bacterium]|nr:rubrerythrin family protein [Candidatus Paceibacterota bacterium]